MACARLTPAIQQRPDRRYRARYRDAPGREHTKHFPTFALAEQWQKEQEASVVRHDHVAPRRDLVFDDGGEVLRNYRLRRRWFDSAARAAGIEGLVPHELRHTAASLAIATSASIKALQSMLGHATATLTLDLYGHLYPDELDAVAARLDVARVAMRTGSGLNVAALPARGR